MKINNIFRVLVIFFVAMLLFNNYTSFAIDMNSTNIRQFDDESYTAWETAGSLNLNVKGGTQKLIGTVLSILRVIVMAWAIIMLLLIGIKYIVSAPNIKAQLKMDVPTYIAGAVLLFGAAGVMRLIEYFVDATIGK